MAGGNTVNQFERFSGAPLGASTRLFTHSTLFGSLLALLFTPLLLSAGGFPSGATTLPLLAARGDDLACNQGDWAHCPNAQGGLATNKFHAYFVEIPAGTGNLTLQLFDPDIGAGAGEAAAGRDTGVATAAQAVQYSLRDPAGTVQTIRFDRGNGVSTVGATTTGLATTAGVGVSCSTAATTTADNAWCTLFTATNPAAGHWELRAASITGTPLHYFGVRAQDSSTSRDLNVYARSYIHYGNQNVNAGRVYNGSNAFYPYVTEGCQLRAADFDSDDTTTESIRYRSRTGSFDQTFTEAAGDISGNDAWNDELMTFTSAQAATQYGIWLNEVSSGTDTANHVTPWLGSELSTASPPTTQPQGGSDRGTPVVAGESYRLYFPNNAGGAPTKPFFEQRMSFVSGATPPVAGTLSVYRVTMSAVNPTPYPIDFADNASNDLLISLVPNDIPNTGGGRRNYAYVNPSFLTTCGSIVAEPANNADDAVIEWNPGTIPANTSCTAEYQVRLTPGTADTTGTVVPLTGNGATDGTIARFLDETDTRFIFGPLCTLSLTVGTAVAVPVTLAYFDATLASDGALNVQWGTDSEAGSIGFNLYSGNDNDARRKLNQQLIAARGGNTLDATEYSARLFDYDGKSLWIEEISAGGKSTVFGPFRLNQVSGSKQARSAIDWAPTRQAWSAQLVQARGNASHDELLLHVSADGAYRLRFEDIAAQGVNWTGADSAQLALELNGAPQDLAVDGGAIWQPGSAIRFIGQANNNSLYTRDRIYHLRRNVFDARRMTKVFAVHIPTPLIEDYRRTITADPNNAWSFSAPIADPWYAFALTRVGAQRPTQGLSVNATHRISGTDAVLRASLWGGLNYADGPDHRVVIDLNGQPIADQRFDGIGAHWVDHVLQATDWNNGSNTVNFTLDDSGFETDRVHIESISLSYQSELHAEADRLMHHYDGVDRAYADTLFANGLGDSLPECAGSTDCTGFRALGFSDNSVLAYRLRSAQTQQLIGSIETASSGFALRYGGDQHSGDRYVLTTIAAHRTPIIERARPLVDLFEAPAQYLAIAPAFMLDTLEPLLAMHRANGLSARAIAIEDIYPQFGDGSSDPEALRRFVQAAYTEIGTRYLLIAGGDTYDYFNYTGAGSVSLVPTFYRNTHPLIRYGATDVPYGDIDGDDRLDIAVGRLPARNVLELQRLVAKTMLLSNNSVLLPALLVADQPGDETNFGLVSDQFELSANSAYRAARTAPERVFLSAGADIAAARNQMFANINAGRQWVSYYGHGSPIGWTFAGLLSANDVGAGLFTNSGTPFLATMWGCWGGFFVDPNYQGLSHALLVGTDSGAGAIIAATGLTETVNDESFAALLVPAMTRPGARLGDAFRSAQNQFAIEHPDARDVSMGMLLLGDPALRLMQ
jgi:Peptidase family C25